MSSPYSWRRFLPPHARRAMTNQPTDTHTASQPRTGAEESRDQLITSPFVYIGDSVDQQTALRADRHNVNDITSCHNRFAAVVYQWPPGAPPSLRTLRRERERWRRRRNDIRYERRRWRRKARTRDRGRLQLPRGRHRRARNQQTCIYMSCRQIGL